MSSASPDSSDPRSAATEPGAGVGFTTTEWSIVLAAGSDTAAKQAALERLCRTYWQPIYAFIRRSGSDHEQAQDMTQTFFRAFAAK